MTIVKRINDQTEKRKIRVRAKLKRFAKRLRLSIYRSNKHISGQIIDNKTGKTLILVSDQHLKLKNEKLTKLAIAKKVGQLLAQKAKKIKINQVYLDRGAYKYHGRIKALAEGAREGELKI